MAMARLPSELRHAGFYATSTELGFPTQRTENELAQILSGLSAYDCMGMIGRLSAWYYSTPRATLLQAQAGVADWLASRDTEWRKRLRGALQHGAIVVFPQQLTHLARLVARYADPRPPEEFADQQAQRDFLACLFGVADLFLDADVDLRDADHRLAWALRHTGIGQRRERLTLWSTYYEVFCRVWPESAEYGLPDVDAAFERFTSMSIRKFMAVGMAFSFSFAAAHEGPVGRAWLDIDSYFSQTKLAAEDIRTFLMISGTTLDQLRDDLAWEEEKFGPTTFGALAYERTPLLMDPHGRVYLINLESLERRVTEGILHILAEGAEDEGGTREDYTSPFGKAFQQWTSACFERVNAVFKKPPTLFVDVPYGSKRELKYTPDVVLRYPRTIVAVEIVSGPMQARTLTHGDLSTFEADLIKLVDKKAGQLTKRISEILTGEAAEIGLDADDVGMVWPVIITATSFPMRPEIGPVIRARLKKKGLLQHRKVQPVSIVTAEEIAASEGTMAEGTSFAELLGEWKHSARTGDHPFKNFLISRERDQRRPPAEHRRDIFSEASRDLVGLVLEPHAVDDALKQTEGG
jgi:hypothetical protein